VNKTINELKNMANSYSVEFKELPNNHIQLSNHGILVNYWPLSKKRTCHIKNGEVVHHCSNYDAIKLCLQSGVVGLKPKKKVIKENVAHGSFKPITTNPAGIKHLYDGDKPMWDGTGMIMCVTDMLRVEARKLLDQAEQWETPAFYQDYAD
jgi:hypothetical protein